jgi:hypothetical protein
MTLFIVPVLYDLLNGKKMKAREIQMIKEAAGMTGDEVLDGDTRAYAEATPSAPSMTVPVSETSEESAPAPVGSESAPVDTIPAPAEPEPAPVEPEPVPDCAQPTPVPTPGPAVPSSEANAPESAPAFRPLRIRLKPRRE